MWQRYVVLFLTREGEYVTFPVGLFGPEATALRRVLDNMMHDGQYTVARLGPAPKSDPFLTLAEFWNAYRDMFVN